MKAWQIIGTVILSFIITACLAVSTVYLVLDRTVLDGGRVKAALSGTQFYADVKNDLLIPTIQTQIVGDAEFGGPLTQTDVIDSLREAFPDATVKTMTDTVIDASYAWINKKAPSIDVSIDISSQKQAFLDALTKRVDANLQKLPYCRSLSQVGETLADTTCISPYLTREAYRNEIMDTVRSHVTQADSTVTAETLHLDDASLDSAQDAPDYVSYLWTLNLLTLPVAALLSLYLIIKRRGPGLMAFGICIVFVAAACLIGARTIPAEPQVTIVPLRSLASILVPKVTGQLNQYGGVGILSGIVLFSGGIVWSRLARRTG